MKPPLSALLALCSLSFLLAASVSAQDESTRTPGQALVGHWQGAYIRSHSLQMLRAEFFLAEESGELQVRFEVPEWFYYGWLQPKSVKEEEDGRFSFDGFYGRVILAHDERFGELVGQVGAQSPPVTMHLKRALPPAPDAQREIRLKFASEDGTTIGGTLVLPAGPGPHPLVVQLAGRGCSPRAAMLPRCRIAARYGIAGFALDKRGQGESEGDCDTNTFEQLVADTRAGIEQLAARDEIDGTRIGLFGVSAGGWVALRVAATSSTPIAALMTLVGPSTSVEEQQRDNCRIICEQLDLSDEERARAERYLDLMFRDLAPSQAQFEEMMRLKASAEQAGWAQFFEETDIPVSAEELDRLWVRRFRYDPSEDWRKIECPTLMVFGANDRVVPAEKNAARARELFGGDPDELEILIQEGSGHGSESPDMWRSIVPRGDRAYPVTYFKFDKVDWHTVIPFVDFARRVFELD